VGGGVDTELGDVDLDVVGHVALPGVVRAVRVGGGTLVRAEPDD
jgi:hypothetical protein